MSDQLNYIPRGYHYHILFFIHVGCSGQLARTLTNPHGP